MCRFVLAQQLMCSLKNTNNKLIRVEEDKKKNEKQNHFQMTTKNRKNKKKNENRFIAKVFVCVSLPIKCQQQLPNSDSTQFRR